MLAEPAVKLREGLTFEEAETLLKEVKEPLYLIVGNVAGRIDGSIRFLHTGAIAPGDMFDNDLLKMPLSSVHPRIPSIVELGQGLEMLRPVLAQRDPNTVQEKWTLRQLIGLLIHPTWKSL